MTERVPGVLATIAGAIAIVLGVDALLSRYAPRLFASLDGRRASDRVPSDTAEPIDSAPQSAEVKR